VEEMRKIIYPLYHTEAIDHGQIFCADCSPWSGKILTWSVNDAAGGNGLICVVNDAKGVRPDILLRDGMIHAIDYI